jgi:hypothetical protein
MHRDRTRRVRGIGREAVHVAIDDCRWSAYSEVLADEGENSHRIPFCVSGTQALHDARTRRRVPVLQTRSCRSAKRTTARPRWLSSHLKAWLLCQRVRSWATH